jgi:hypothetical protein
MKHSSRLITNVRRIFAFGRGLAVLGVVLVPLIVFIPLSNNPIDLGAVSFKSPAPVVKNTADDTNRVTEIHNLRGDLSLQLVSPEERRVSRIVWSVKLGIDVVLSFFVCHWMWRLCCNAENGEIFAAANLLLVQRLGWLLIADALLSFAVRLWSSHYIAAYVTENLSFRGLEVVTPQSADLLLRGEPSSVEIAINQIIIGLLVLCLTEVFRQGLKLKQEAELTV